MGRKIAPEAAPLLAAAATAALAWIGCPVVAQAATLPTVATSHSGHSSNPCASSPSIKISDVPGSTVAEVTALANRARLSLPRGCGQVGKVRHAALAICSQAWAGVKKPSAEWRRRRL